MALKTYFLMLFGKDRTLVGQLVGLLPNTEIIWAALGDGGQGLLEPTHRLQPSTYQSCKVALAVKCEEGSLQALLDKHKMAHAYLAEVEQTEWHPLKEQLDRAEVMSPDSEPAGILQVLRHNWFSLLTVENLVRNVVRMQNIVLWGLFHVLWARDMHKPFHMINLMQFRGNEGIELYDLYRDEAGKPVLLQGKLIMSKGGSMGFLANIKGGGMDEVMIVHYKNRWQFLRMAAFTPSYWVLA